jgi:plastocyanin
VRRLLLVLLPVLALGACTSDDATPSATTQPACIEAADASVTLVAKDLQWNTSCLRATVGALTIVVDNQDDGDNHNVHLPDAPGSPATKLSQGPSTTELDVTLELGTYEYVCDIHPNMVGTLHVVAAS